MCNRARLSYDPETLRTHFGAIWAERPPNRNPIELAPRAKAPVIRVKARIKPDGLAARGFSADRPVADNNTEAGRAVN